MSEDRRSRSRSRSRSPERGGEDNNTAPPSDNGAPADDNNNAPSGGGGGEEEGVKLYVGNLDYCTYHYRSSWIQRCCLLLIIGGFFSLAYFLLSLLRSYYVQLLLFLQPPMNLAYANPSVNSAPYPMYSSPWNAEPPALVALAL